MDAESVVYARLANQTTAQGRVYPLILPQGPAYPAISYQVISTQKLHAMGQDVPLTRVRVQVSSWGETYAAATTLAGQVAGRLSRFKGQAAGVTVQDVLLDNQLPAYESETQTRRVIQDYTLFITL